MDRPARILSIEDENSLRRSIVAYLEDSGYDLLEAENGRDGLEKFFKEKPDVVLCDLRMPEVDGLTVLSQIRDFSPDTPFIIVSGTGDMHDAVEALKLGAWDFITKPIQDMEVLEHSVARALIQLRLINENREYQARLESTNAQLARSLRQLEEDESAARKVQFQLLPLEHLKHDAIEFSRFIKPSAFLSGDFVDYFSIDNGRWGFYIADVSGHGASSAFVTVLLKSMVGYLLDEFLQNKNETILHPDQVLSHLGQRLSEQKLGKYATVFYGVIDERNDTLTYANGGHFPRPILFAGAPACYLEEKNLPVGMFKTANYSATTVGIRKPFVLAAFSDGIFEVLKQEGLKNQQEHLLSLFDDTDIVMSDLVEELKLDSKETPPDDVTVLLIKKT